jgi:hypothetical protein
MGMNSSQWFAVLLEFLMKILGARRSKDTDEEEDSE